MSDTHPQMAKELDAIARPRGYRVRWNSTDEKYGLIKAGATSGTWSSDPIVIHSRMLDKG